MDFGFANAYPEKSYFFRINQELIKALRKQDATRSELESQALHYMKCPKCGHDLKVVQLGSMTAERCTGCEGMFFDRDEWKQLFGAPESPSDFLSTLHTLLVGEDKSY